VKFLIYDETTQRTCPSPDGQKMLVALMMEGKFSGEGIHSLDADDDLLAAMARELVQQSGVGQSAMLSGTSCGASVRHTQRPQLRSFQISRIRKRFR